MSCWCAVRIRRMQENGAFPAEKLSLGKRSRRLRYERSRRRPASSPARFRLFTAVDVFDRDERGQLLMHYVLIAVLCEWMSSVPQAAGDALEAGWFAIETLTSLDVAMRSDVARVASMAAKVQTESR